MFRGESECNLDEKGRILVPARYREELGEVVVLGRGGDGQINVFPRAFFDEMERRVQESGDSLSFHQTDRFLAAANECEVDRQGRLLIPATLRKHADLTGEVIVVGNRDHLEIWNSELWLQIYKQWVTDFRSNRDDFVKIRQTGLRV